MIIEGQGCPIFWEITMSDEKYSRTTGVMVGYHQKNKEAELEVPDNNINYLCVSAGEINMAAEIANLRDSPFNDEVKNENAKHMMKCWNTHAKLMIFLTEIATNNQPWYKAEKTIKRKAKKLLEEGLR
jgi:hypothetical protein